ncbi:MAG: ParB/RepB/Spo0J family partition protein [Pyrinomonadaceae bacterium]|nr:ParB/RepB/Spo0J family partition protein [Pyrinomonadaceae bacterium]
MARQALGSGLSALISEERPEATLEARIGTSEIDIDLIEPNPQQPRKRFKGEELEGLQKSITANGIIQPIVVRPFGGRYQIVAGERRWRAAQLAGLRRIPATVKEVSDEKLLEMALVENIQRQELNPIEEANAYRQLIDTIGLTQELLAERVGKARSIIATSVRLLKLPDEIQEAIADGGLTAGHGRALLLVDDAVIQRNIANIAVELGLSVRETERAIKRARTGKLHTASGEVVVNAVDANVKAAETKLMRALNTGVKIRKGQKGRGGKIEIEYYSTDDLDRIFQVIISK